MRNVWIWYFFVSQNSGYYEFRGAKDDKLIANAAHAVFFLNSIKINFV